MTASAFNLVDFDDGPTLVQPSPVFHTEIMQRRQMPQPPSLSPDVTHPAIRVRRDLAGTRRIAASLAIGFAFLFGLAGAFVFQTMNAEAAAPPMSVRTPRSLTERSSSLDTRSTPDALPRAEEAPIASAPRARVKRPAVTTPTEDEPPAARSESESESESFDGRDLLGEGLAQ